MVSPIAELTEIAQLTSTASVFSVSRIYSRAIRDGFTSPESLALVTVHIGDTESAEWDLELAHNLVQRAFEPVKSRLSRRDREWLNVRWERRRSSAVTRLPEASVPTHEITLLEKGTVFRTIWPHPIALVEGHAYVTSGGTLHSTVVHCERILHLVSGVHYRRLQDSPRVM